MKRIRKKIKRMKGTFNKYVNGTKGVISIFLALVMLPFTSIGLLLVESARYQNAAELVDEMLDCVGLSSIADFDSYLEDRFGLLSISQETDPETNYNKYLNANISALSNSFSYSSSSVEGVYPLSDEGVLKSQLLEYSEVTAMAEMLYKGFDIDDLLKELYDKLGVSELNKYADAVTKTADIATSVVDLITALEEAKKKNDAYNSEMAEYKKAVMDFQSKSDALITALNKAKSALPEDASESDIYADEAVVKAVTECETARDKLKTEAGEMSTSVEEMGSQIDKLFSTMNKITENINSAKSAYDEVSSTSVQQKCTTSTGEWIIEIASELTNILKAAVKSTYKNDMKEQSRLLDAQKTKMETVICNMASDGNTTKYYIDVNTSSTKVKEDFCAVTLDSVNSSFSSIMQEAIDNLNSDNKSGISDEEKASLGKLLDVAGELLKVTVFYNGELDSQVSSSAYHRYNASDVSFSSTAVMSSLTTIVQSGKDFVDSIKGLNVIKALKAAAEFLIAIGEFLVGIVAWVAEVAINLGKFITSGSEIYDTFLLSAYSVYNMPCRTTYDSGSSLSGFSYSKVFDEMGGVSGNRFTGAMSDLDTLLSETGGGTDPGFKGAEVEYLLIGSDNEMLNQSATFFNLYMLRMLLDLAPIFSNEQVATMAGSATVAGWVVYIAIIVAEPMIDALMLVNGQSEYLLKNQIYLTPGGMVLLLQKLPSLTGLSSATRGKIKDAMIAENGEPKASGTLKMDYSEHLLVLLLLTTEQSKLLSRIANVVQMEAGKHYKDSYTFDLDKANTYIEATVSGRLNSMFDLKALTANGPFTMKRTKIIGY